MKAGKDPLEKVKKGGKEGIARRMTILEDEDDEEDEVRKHSVAYVAGKEKVR